MRKYEKKIYKNEIYAKLFLSEEDSLKIINLFKDKFQINKKYLMRNFSITVYYSRRYMKGVENISEKCNVVIPTKELRFMLMAPGGENPRKEFGTHNRKVGVRIRKNTKCFEDLCQYRQRLLEFESNKNLGIRNPSTMKNNAFGARKFQPHISLLRAGSGLDNNLKITGDILRNEIPELVFDKFKIINRSVKSGFIPN